MSALEATRKCPMTLPPEARAATMLGQLPRQEKKSDNLPAASISARRSSEPVDFHAGTQDALARVGRFHRDRLTHLHKSTRCAPPNALRGWPFPTSVMKTDARNEQILGCIGRCGRSELARLLSFRKMRGCIRLSRTPGSPDRSPPNTDGHPPSVCLPQFGETQ